MAYEKYDVITFEDDSKVVVLEKINYEENTYLYVEELDEKENLLNEFKILRVSENDMLEKEINQKIITELLLLINKRINRKD